HFSHVPAQHLKALVGFVSSVCLRATRRATRRLSWAHSAETRHSVVYLQRSKCRLHRPTLPSNHQSESVVVIKPSTQYHGLKAPGSLTNRTNRCLRVAWNFSASWRVPSSATAGVLGGPYPSRQACLRYSDHN